MARYISSADVLGADPSRSAFTRANAVTYLDLEGSWTNQGVTFTIGVDNIRDMLPRP